MVNYLNNVYWLLPEIILSVCVVFILGYGVVFSKQGGLSYQFEKITYFLILFMFIAFSVSFNLFLGHLSGDLEINIVGLFYSNCFISFLKTLILFVGVIVLLLSIGFFRRELCFEYEIPILIILAIIGMLFLISSSDLISLYLSVELLSLSSYILASFF